MVKFAAFVAGASALVALCASSGVRAAHPDEADPRLFEEARLEREARGQEAQDEPVAAHRARAGGAPPVPHVARVAAAAVAQKDPYALYLANTDGLTHITNEDSLTINQYRALMALRRYCGVEHDLATVNWYKDGHSDKQGIVVSFKKLYGAKFASGCCFNVMHKVHDAGFLLGETIPEKSEMRKADKWAMHDASMNPSDIPFFTTLVRLQDFPNLKAVVIETKETITRENGDSELNGFLANIVLTLANMKENDIDYSNRDFRISIYDIDGHLSDSLKASLEVIKNNLELFIVKLNGKDITGRNKVEFRKNLEHAPPAKRSGKVNTKKFFDMFTKNKDE